MSVYEEIFDSNDFEYEAARDVDSLVQDSRREALEDALSRLGTLDECWEVFRQFVTEAIVDDDVFRKIVLRSRAEIALRIVESEYDKVLNIAALKLMNRKHEDVVTKAAQLMLSDQDAQSEIRRTAIDLLRNQLRDDIGKEVREELIADQTFVAEVKRDLKRQIMGI